MFYFTLITFTLTELLISVLQIEVCGCGFIMLLLEQMVSFLIFHFVEFTLFAE